MKKLVIVSSLIAALASAPAFAKTEGHYLGIDLHRSVLESKQVNLGGSSDKRQFETSKTGLGVSYKYAFNFNKIFIAPGLFYERLGNKNYALDDEGEGLGGSYLAAQNRYGVRTDFGYDVTDNLGLYVTVGYTEIGYSAYAQDQHSPIPGEPTQKRINKRDRGMMYGFGAISKISDHVSLGFEYNTQDFSVMSPDQLSPIRHKANLDLYKVTLAYRF